MWGNLNFNPHSFLVLRVTRITKSLFKMKHSAQAISYSTEAGEITANVMYLHAILGKRTSESKTKIKGTIFYRYEVEVTMPDGRLQTADANLWANSFAKHADKFAEGSNITLEVQTEGDYKGRAKIQLPKSRAIDVDAFLGITLDMEEESILKGNVIKKEEVF